MRKLWICEKDKHVCSLFERDGRTGGPTPQKKKKHRILLRCAVNAHHTYSDYGIYCCSLFISYSQKKVGSSLSKAREPESFIPHEIVQKESISQVRFRNHRFVDWKGSRLKRTWPFSNPEFEFVFSNPGEIWWCNRVPVTTPWYLNPTRLQVAVSRPLSTSSYLPPGPSRSTARVPNVSNSTPRPAFRSDWNGRGVPYVPSNPCEVLVTNTRIWSFISAVMCFL